MHELFEHTADLGLRVVAPDLDTLFAEAAAGLFSIIVENLDEVRPLQELSFKIAGQDKNYLFFDWLNELLYTFETQHMLLSRFHVHIDETGLTARAVGEPIDSNRHQLDHEVKAITYHDLEVVETEDGWRAQVIVDI